MRRFSPLLILGFLALGIALVLFKRQQQSGAIPTSGGTPLDLAAISGAHFLQSDSRWSESQIGGSGERIAKVGCTICSVAMALDVCGFKTDPDQLNTALKEQNGFTSSGLLKWKAVEEISKGKIKITYLGKPSYPIIDNALKKGQPVIAKIFLNNIVPHWVLIIGMKNGEYLVRDPAQQQPVILSSRAHSIYAIRILDRVTQ